MISKEIYHEIEDIVGPDNVSCEPAVLDGYAFQTFQNRTDSFPWIPRPEVVVLPGNTNEVQQVVKLCNRHKMKFKALSTGWGAWSGPGSEGVVQIDLKRMNRILEIDEKNMFVVIEPYVICAQLQAEMMKLGLNVHIIGAGSNTSALASATSVGGYGACGLATGFSGRNLLGVEWVLPNGEILRLGSLGSGSGWFCGDGPGPSLRGIMRGWLGAMGGLGVFTRCALKLYQWPAGKAPRVEGRVMDLQAEVPRNLKTFFCVFPGHKQFADAGYRICDAEIGYMLCKHALGNSLAVFTPRLLRRLCKKSSLRAALDAYRYQFQVILATETEEELEYEEKVLTRIMEETGGALIDLSKIPLFHRLAWWHFIRASMTPGAFRMGGNFTTTFGSSAAWDNAVLQALVGDELKERLVNKGLLLDDLKGNAWGGLYEGTGHFGHQEVVVMYDAHRREQVNAAIEFSSDCMDAAVENCLGVGIPSPPLDFHGRMGPVASDYHLWQRRLKKAFDPEDLSDSSHYIPPGE